jgi:3-phosphoshikimate 1-carboxyvinyltransferase
VFSGVQSLKIKETDRVAALIAELAKFGYQLHEPQHGQLAWDGTQVPVSSEVPSVKTYEDHRMAMAFAPLALIQPIIIEEPNVVSKSYPRFWEDLELID